MFVITGYSEKLDGFIFVSWKDSQDEALGDLLSIRPGMELKTNSNGDLYFLKEFDGDIEDFGGEPPRNEGWILYCGPLTEEGFCPDAVCW